MQSLSNISTTAGKPLILGPLTFVIGLSAFKDLIEDHARTKSDNLENAEKAHVFDKTDKEEIKAWKDIEVGDIVKVKVGESIPCDILLLITSDPNALCYVETKSLDGETNLKVRSARKTKDQETYDSKTTMEIYCDHPNEHL